MTSLQQKFSDKIKADLNIDVDPATFSGNCFMDCRKAKFRIMCPLRSLATNKTKKLRMYLDIMKTGYILIGF